MIRITLEDQDENTIHVQGLPRMAGRFFSLTPDGMREAMQACGKQSYTIDGALLDLCAPARPKIIMLPAEHTPLAHLVTPQWDHQRDGTHLIMTRGGVLIAADMGTGKTKMLIDAAQNLRCKRVLIIAPKAVTKNWPREVAIHAIPEYRYLLANDVDQSVAFRAHQIMSFVGTHTALPEYTPEIIVVDHATCWREDIAHLLLGYDFDLIAVDEAHKICDPSNKLSQFVYALAERNPDARRVALTGTPFDKLALKVFGIARFVAPEIVGTNKWAFDHKHGVFKRFTVPTKQGVREVEKFERLADKAAFEAMVAQFTYRVSKEDVLKLPPQTHTRRYAFMTATQRSQYKRLAKEWEAEIAGKTLNASSAAIMVMRLQQFTGLLKGDLLAETLEVLDGQPCVVFARFAEDLAIVRETCKKAGLIYQEQSGRASEWDRWQDGYGDVLGVQEQSGGQGINLTRAAHAIFYSHERREIEYKQSLSRLHRPGQERHVSYIHLCVDGTKDDEIIDALQSGCDATEAILNNVQKTQQKESETQRNAA